MQKTTFFNNFTSELGNFDYFNNTRNKFIKTYLRSNSKRRKLQINAKSLFTQKLMSVNPCQNSNS